MVKYEVNKPFPFPHPMPGMEVTITDITTAFVDIKCYICSPTSDEMKDWRRGRLKYGIYEHDFCVWLLLKFPDWTIDASINILKIKSDSDRDNWLNADGNVITLFLIDSNTNALAAMRTISVKKGLAERIKDLLEQQTHKYDTVADCEKRIVEIQHTLSTDYMISKTTMYEI